MSVASVDGMKYEWKQTEFAINTKNAAVGKFTPQYQIKAASGEVLADQPALVLYVIFQRLVSRRS